MFTVKTINLTGELATLSQQAFGVFEPDNVAAVKALLEPKEDADVAARAEKLVEIAVAHQAELAMLEKKVAHFQECWGVRCCAEVSARSTPRARCLASILFLRRGRKGGDTTQNAVAHRFTILYFCCKYNIGEHVV